MKKERSLFIHPQSTEDMGAKCLLRYLKRVCGIKSVWQVNHPTPLCWISAQSPATLVVSGCIVCLPSSITALLIVSLCRSGFFFIKKIKKLKKLNNYNNFLISKIWRFFPKILVNLFKFTLEIQYFPKLFPIFLSKKKKKHWSI